MNGHLTPELFVSKAKAAGYKWVAYQWNDGATAAQQQALAPATRQACQGNLMFCVWMTRPFDAASARQAAVESECEGLILEGEIPSEDENGVPRPEAVNWPEVIFQLSNLDIPKAVVSNFAPFVHGRTDVPVDDPQRKGKPWPEKAKPLIDDGWAYISENFITEAPNATPANTDFYAKTALGWPETHPMIEGWHVQDYGDLSRFRNVSHWDAGIL